MTADDLLVLRGRLFIAASVLFLLLATSALSADFLFKQTGFELFRVLASDTHYKYFTLLLIPTTSYFVIANWVGWQYYRNA